ncbi:protein tyrosine/serine phosphatase [Rhizobium sp. BK650]|uniref:dual specificity protein phosphatase family protein n=1 Tax=Rhizobium sp. BK650 TaxID=2586990 RepID=UPI0017DA0936|nr:dual specificity protein phosphatase family protein [Rhizobium sp. BK650]MBB3658526.1 protein tyrosine/serine phosphatase [Rhizobium sp. BK650]
MIRLTLLLLVVTGAYLGYLQLSTNVHAVVEGEVYRSAQPSPAKLGELVKEYGIKSVLNLRGDDTGAAWYDNEVAAAKGLNVQHIDFRMSATKELSIDEGRQLMAIMAAAPKPLLIHCKAGADRTGLASAIYVAGVAKEGEMAAESQISLTYGHLSLFFIGAYAMDETFERLEPLFGFSNS